ncbi:MAG: hypothetical protein JOZ30_01725 [Hyphomicrobiales bacterium]|nr:hypothetical protein [Hyphomicrobiales bacterium]
MTYIMNMRTQSFVHFCHRAASLLALFLAASCFLPVTAQAFDFGGVTASGTHVCSGPTERQCVVSGSIFRNCIDAANALKVQDCCRTNLSCSRDPKTGAKKCESASTSTKFTLDYCVGSSGRH